MMELINKENLKANILKMLSISGEEYLRPAERAIWNVINAEPTQEIIHCKGCEHDSDNDYCHCKYVTWWNKPDDYCSRAEKKGNADDEVGS